ncbi:MAG TPA: methylenetetrahydrofolate reductase [Acidimicrobiales bacterium]|nr:methylenetetrahydrofolate reductase [Acidimicrobiales bacterium]
MTKIADLLAGGPTFSVEFPAPKTPAMLRQLEKTVLELSPFEPSFASVTYGAGGSTKDGTLEAVLFVHRNTDLVVMPHLTCAGQTHADVLGLVERYRDEGIENLLALAGDPPLDGNTVGDFRYAAELIDLANEHAEFTIGVSAFPEVHPNSPSREEDRRRLSEKLVKADFAITQFFWSAEHYFRMRDELDAIGCTKPVIPSLFPIGNVEVARRITGMNGAEWPSWLEDRLAAVEGDPDGIRRVGIDVATEIGADLLAQDPPGLHLYTLNRPEAVAEIWHNLDLDGRRS